MTDVSTTRAIVISVDHASEFSRYVIGHQSLQP